MRKNMQKNNPKMHLKNANSNTHAEHKIETFSAFLGSRECKDLEAITW